jgi:NAD-dependent dihydropyrimidine dehydrogenase PreA subunit
MKKTIIQINPEKCTGCGQCAATCHQGAIQIINGKAVLVDEHHCDGLGRCIGNCPSDAITFIEKEMEEPKKEQPIIPKISCCVEHIEQNRPQFPIQLHLINPLNPQFHDADLLLAADCTAFVLPDFQSLKKEKRLVIACPKLDDGQEIYVEKLRQLIEESHIASLTVAIMEVPCCTGLLRLANAALEQTTRKIPLKKVVVGIHGEIK